MPDEIKPNDTELPVEDPKIEVEVDNDKGGEDEEKEVEVTPEKEKVVDDEFDDSKIDPEVRSTTTPAKEGEEDLDMDEEEKARVEKIVQKQVGTKLTEMENKMEVAGFIGAKPEYAKYKDAMLKYMNHPAYSNVPVQNIAAIVASKDMQKLGAAKEREAQRIVAETKSPGSNFRKPTTEKIDWMTASKEEVEAKKRAILHPGS